MTDISNKTLALLMVAAVVVSLGGLFVSLDRLSKLGGAGTEGANGVTGFAIALGRANVTITSSATITMSDSSINFGACTLPSVGTLANISSNNSNGGGYCDGVFPDYVTVVNTGNNNLNISVKTNVSAREFLGPSNSNNTQFYFMTRNGTGCMNNVNFCANNNCCEYQYLLNNSFQNGAIQDNCTLANNWVNLSAFAWVEFAACKNLTYGGVERNFTLYARIDIPDDLAPGQDRRAALNFSSYVVT